MGYKTLWVDNKDDVSKIDFSNTLFITEHQVDGHMPLREDCWYVVHHSVDSKYDSIKKRRRYVDLKVYRNWYLSSPTLKQVEPCIYYDVPEATIIMPWATDLLPEEIERNKQNSPVGKPIPSTKKIHWVGTIGGGEGGNINELTPFMQACKDRKIPFIQTDPWSKPASSEENIALIQQSYIAPVICGKIQLVIDYIPCRLFKNIGYGHIGATNSRACYELFNKKIVYNPNTYALFADTEKKLLEGNVQELYELMDLIKEKHTYLNRANHILQFIELLDLDAKKH